MRIKTRLKKWSRLEQKCSTYINVVLFGMTAQKSWARCHIHILIWPSSFSHLYYLQFRWHFWYLFSNNSNERNIYPHSSSIYTFICSWLCCVGVYSFLLSIRPCAMLPFYKRVHFFTVKNSRYDASRKLWVCER